MTEILRELRIGYASSGRGLIEPGDRRRFCFYAERRGIPYQTADPDDEYDIVIVTAMADVVTWRKRTGGRAKIVFDLIDSYLAVPQLAARSMFRGLAKYAAGQTGSLVLNYRAAIEDMCRRSDAVVCSTDEQRAAILRLCPNVHVILDDHSELGPLQKSDFALGDTVHLVWEGLPYTLGGFEEILGVLRQIAIERPVALHLLTDLTFARYARRFVRVQTETIARGMLPETYVYQWNRHLLPHIATACDIAVIPLDIRDPLAWGKPENKLLLFWRLGIPTVTSATPAYRRAMEECGLDLTCETSEDWATTLRRVIADHALRATSSRLGRQFVQSNHSEERLLARWDQMFESLMIGPGMGPLAPMRP